MIPEKSQVNASWLVVGGGGILGRSLAGYWRQRDQPAFCTTLSGESCDENMVALDLADNPDNWPALPSCRAAVICAGITNIEACRQNPEKTRWVNVTQTLRLCKLLVERNCFVVFISSNLVFDGSKPLRKSDEPLSPLTEYGRQKSEVEAGLWALGDNVGIVRLTKVFYRGMPLIQKWIQSLKNHQLITAFHDMMCSPIPLNSVVRSIAEVAERQMTGIWQLSANDDVTYEGVARQVARESNCDLSLIHPMSARDAGLEHLPSYTTLDASRAQNSLGFEIPEPSKAISQTWFS